MHHPVPLPEANFAANFFLFSRLRRIEGRLQRLIEPNGPGLSLSCRADDLDLRRGDPHIFRQTLGAKLGNGLHHGLRRTSSHEEEVTVLGGQNGQLPLIDRVGVHDDEALPGLAEDLRQGDRRHRAAADQIGKEISRSHGRKLVRITDQNQACLLRQGFQQAVHQKHVHHGHLIDDQRVAVQGLALVALKIHLPGLWRDLCFQKAVNGGRITSRQLRQAFCGPSRGRGQKGLSLQPVKEGQDPRQGCGLACTGSAGQNHDLSLGSQADGLLLLLGVGDVVFRLHGGNGSLRVMQDRRRCRGHAANALGDLALGLIILRQIDRRQTRDLVQLHTAQLRQPLQSSTDRRRVQIQQRGRRFRQLVQGQKGMAVVEVIPQFKNDRRLHPAIIVAVKAQLQRQRVGGGKGRAELRQRQEIGIVAEALHSAVAVNAVEAHGDLCRDAVGR